MKPEQNSDAQNLATEFTVEDREALERLDRFLSARLAGQLSREKIKKCILDGQVLIGGQPCLSPKRNMLAGDVVRLSLPGQAAAAQPEAGELNIVYEDEHIAVLEKPHGLSVHPSPSEVSGTLVNRLLDRFPSLSNMDGERPGIVHRLDKDTTGLMLVALEEPARLTMIEAFAGREVHKEYLALVYGVPQQARGRIDAPIGRDSRNKTRMAVHARPHPTSTAEAREARSDYRTLYADPMGRFALLAVEIHSGRTHQIRVHLSHIGHPIIGDKVYGDEADIKKALSPREISRELREYLASAASHQLLHAWHLAFSHPAMQREMSFCATPPEDFSMAAKALSARLLRVVLTGNPACGKSSVLKIMRGRGLPIWSADEAVAREYRAGADGWQLIRAQYGDRFMLAGPSGESDINKSALFKAMYADDRLRRSIEGIIHPIVNAEMLDFWNSLDRLPLKAAIAVAEVPLYLEGAAGGGAKSPAGSPVGFAPERPLVLGIHCPFKQRSRRLKETRDWPDEMINTIESWQWAEDKKMAACDLVIDNSGSPEDLEKEVDKALASLLARPEKRLDEIAKILDGLGNCA